MQKRGSFILVLLIVPIILLASMTFAASCSDTDGGVNYAVKGTVSVKAPVWGFARYLKYTDSCSWVKDKGAMLTEYSCQGDKMARQIIECPNCKDGACPSQIISQNVSSLPSSWDWRNVHGENWLTPNKSQSPAEIGACSEFAFVDSFESQINLYYNQHLDLDLSEQMKIDCNHGTSPLNIKSNDTLVDEACSPFVNRDIFCNGQFQSTQEDKCCNLPYLCNNWQERTWKSLGLDECDIPPYSRNRNCLDFLEFDSEEKIEQAENMIKELLISKGPIKTHISGMRHSMLLVGYKEKKSDWKTIQMCSGDTMCVTNRGCIQRTCNPGESNFTVYNFDPHVNTNTKLTYSCREYGTTGVYQWTMTYYGGYHSSVIPNNTCNPLLYGYARGGQFNSYMKYAPKSGDTIWIFRNSIGGDFEEWPLDVRQFGELTMPSGPFIPPSNEYYWPTGFDGKIKCTDKDSDGYCNWGISDIGKDEAWRIENCPSSCTSQSKKDCNDADSSLDSFCFGAATEATCQDSDWGVNYYVKGITSGTARCIYNGVTQDCTGGPKAQEDICVQGRYDIKIYGEKPQLNENFCGTDGRITVQGTLCPNGCKDGACTQVNQTCTDSDKGKNYVVKGIVTIAYSNGTKQTFTDSCNKDGTLKEWYCKDNAALSGNVKCPVGYLCSSGSCRRFLIRTIAGRVIDGFKGLFVNFDK